MKSRSRAFEHDGWLITDDPLILNFGEHQFFVDLGMEPLIGAALGNQRIAVEIKSFGGPSPITDLERALGQFVLYRCILEVTNSDRELVLAVTDSIYDRLFATMLGELLIARLGLKIVVFDPTARRILRWVPN